MWYTFLKIGGSALLIYFISEVSKRSSFWGAVLASLPFISIIAFIFLYQETKDLEKVAELSINIFWLVIPSLALFISLPILIKKGVQFWLALPISCLITIGAYFVMTKILQYYKLIPTD